MEAPSLPPPSPPPTSASPSRQQPPVPETPTASALPPPPAAVASLPQPPPPPPPSSLPQQPPPVPQLPEPQKPPTASPSQPPPPVPPVPQPPVTQPPASPSQPQPSPPLPQPPEASPSQSQAPAASPPQPQPPEARPPEASPSKPQPQAPAASPSRLPSVSPVPPTSPLKPPQPQPPSASPSQQQPPPSSQQLPQPTPPTTSPSPSTTPSTSTTTTTTPPLPPPIPATTSVKPELPETAEPKQSIPKPPPTALAIPSYSRWFSFASIHETERRAFPGFFDGHSSARTPKTYRYFRDSIVRLFWESPSRRITFTDARRCLVGDVGAIRRIFDFLELWGIINYVPSKTTAPAAEKSSAAAAAAAAAAEEEKEKKVVKAAAGAEGEGQNVVRVRKVCTSCGSVCVQAGFASDKQVDVFLCSKCFVRGNYRGGLSSGDFKRVEAAEDGGKNVRSEWSEKETLHLLEAVLHYGDDWKKVAEHVGNGKTQKDCVARFVKLPFGEQFMGSLGGGRIDGDGWRESMSGDLNDGGNLEELHAAKRMHLTPLADASNPIMAQVAFLSAMVGSDVAEAAAKAAIEAMYNVDSSLRYTNYATNSNTMHGVGDENNPPESGKDFEEAVAEARVLLEQEREDVEQSISDTIEIQMKEILEKINHFEEMELLVEKERSQVQYLRNVLFADQLSLLQQKAKYGSVERSTRNNGPTPT